MINLNLLTLKDFLTMGAAVIGAVLGIMNTWNAMNQKKVRLRVLPAYSIMTASGAVGFSIEVTNLSPFPVTITEVGVMLPGKKRIPILDPFFADRGDWPRRLEARSVVTAHFGLHYLLNANQKFGKAYAHTACGEHRYGSSKALNEVRSQVSG